MNANDLKQWIDGLTQDIDFEYLGITGSICPFSRTNISVSYGGEERTFHSVDDVMNQAFISGKPIKEICKNFIF